MQSEGLEVLYQDTVKVTCNVGYSPKEQIKVCQASGELELPGFEPCEPYVCEEFGVQNGLTYCSTRKCTPRCEDTEYEPCERPIVNKTWHSFNNPNEFKIVCNPGFLAFPFDVPPFVQCSINGTYNTHPECLDSNECMPDFSGPVIDFEMSISFVLIFSFLNFSSSSLFHLIKSDPFVRPPMRVIVTRLSARILAAPTLAAVLMGSSLLR